MNDKMSTQSLIDEMDLPVVEEKKPALNVDPKLEVEKPAPKKSRARKAKPYKQLNQIGKHIEEKKAAKKAVKAGKKEPAKKNLLTGNKKEKKDKPVKKVSKKEVANVASGTGVASGGERCRICHKPLTRGTSISDGMGPECARQIARLPKGTTLEDHYATIIVVDEPKGYLPLREALKIARKFKVTPYRFMIAIGGNRMIRPPLNESFRAVMYKGRRYVPKASVSEKELKKLQ